VKHINFVEMTTSLRNDSGISKVKLPYEPLPGSYHLYELNDFHEGNGAHCVNTLRKTVETIRSKKHARVVLQGDQFEAITVTDKRYDIGVHGNRLTRIQAQRDSIKEKLDPIADKILWILDGNHERHIKNIYQPNADLAKDWNTVYANGTLVKALFDDWRLASWHGAGMINSRAGDALQRATNSLIALKRNMRGLPVDDCDIVACGHYHQCLCHAPTSKLLLVSDGLKLEHAYSQPGRVIVDAKRGFYRIHEDDKYWLCCGSFLKAYEEDMPSYTEDHGYQATELGYGHIEVRNGKPAVVEVVKIV